MTTPDAGWAGSWDVPVISDEMLNALKDIVGAPVMGRNNKPIATCTISLRTGEVTYPPTSAGRIR